MYYFCVRRFVKRVAWVALCQKQTIKIFLDLIVSKNVFLVKYDYWNSYGVLSINIIFFYSLNFSF